MGHLVLTLHFYIFIFFRIDEQAEILPVQFAVGFVVAKFLVTVRHIDKPFVTAVGVALPVPERVHALDAPVAFGIIGPGLVILGPGPDHLPFLHHLAIYRVEVADAGKTPFPAPLLEVEAEAETPHGVLVQAGKGTAVFAGILLGGIGEPGLELEVFPPLEERDPFDSVAHGTGSRHGSIRAAHVPGGYFQAVLSAHGAVRAGIAEGRRGKHAGRPLVFADNAGALLESFVAEIRHDDHPPIEALVEDIMCQHAFKRLETRDLNVIVHYWQGYGPWTDLTLYFWS